ncbi:MAG TPA: thioredoxin-disulfide reductase [Saprospiraceae bacterium]|nr:thioredoxin-disulfide reductase [Saprospiraceae bacterium]
MESKILKTVIIGSGPAGYTAAIYAARAGMEPVLYTGQEPGGQLMITNDVENYPGYPNGVIGPQMMEDFKNQAERFGTRIVFEKIVRVDFTGPVHSIWSETGEEIKTHTVIIATGASAKWLGLESEKKFQNNGVSACAVCDGFFFKGKEVAVVGGGDTAAEESTYLSKLCPKVHLFIRRDEMRASKIMQDRVLKTKNIGIHWNTVVDEIMGSETVEGVRVKNVISGERNEVPIEGFFVAIGHQPNTQIFTDWLETDESGYLRTVPGTTKTSIHGIFVSGDAQDKIYRQAVTAAGTGCMAALDAERYLAEKGIE